MYLCQSMTYIKTILRWKKSHQNNSFALKTELFYPLVEVMVSLIILLSDGFSLHYIQERKSAQIGRPGV